MPTYVYECEAGHEFEMDQKMSDEPLTTCTVVRDRCPGVDDPPCGYPCRRVIVGTSFVLKGKRWAKDGYSG